MPRRHLAPQLRRSAPVVLPSMLLCDFTNLEREVRALEEAGVRALHLDVMDGHFVPNFTYGLTIVEAFRRTTDLPLDVHLMISQPQTMLEGFAEAGADVLTVHIEAVEQPQPVLDQIRELGAAAGIALNPNTPLSRIEPLLSSCDVVLVMSVDAGFGGQQFNPVALEKIRRIREIVGGDTLIEVDGGINRDTIQSCAAAGAQGFVVGSAIFRTPDYAAAINELLELSASPTI